MKESAQVAYTFVKANIDKYKPLQEDFFEQKKLYTYTSQKGATPKRLGPSAGITITSAIISVLTGRKNKTRYSYDRRDKYYRRRF